MCSFRAHEVNSPDAPMRATAIPRLSTDLHIFRKTPFNILILNSNYVEHFSLFEGRKRREIDKTSTRFNDIMVTLLGHQN